MLTITVILIVALFAIGVRQGLHAIRDDDIDARRWAILQIGIAFLAAGILLLQNVDSITSAFVSWRASASVQEEEPVSIRSDSLVS